MHLLRLLQLLNLLQLKISRKNPDGASLTPSQNTAGKKVQFQRRKCIVHKEKLPISNEQQQLRKEIKECAGIRQKSRHFDETKNEIRTLQTSLEGRVSDKQKWDHPKNVQTKKNDPTNLLPDTLLEENVNEIKEKFQAPQPRRLKLKKSARI